MAAGTVLHHGAWIPGALPPGGGRDCRLAGVVAGAVAAGWSAWHGWGAAHGVAGTRPDRGAGGDRRRRRAEEPARHHFGHPRDPGAADLGDVCLADLPAERSLPRHVTLARRGSWQRAAPGDRGPAAAGVANRGGVPSHGTPTVATPCGFTSAMHSSCSCCWQSSADLPSAAWPPCRVCASFRKC
jgi:hypothetical protein